MGLWQFRGISQTGQVCCEEHQVRQEWGEIKITPIITRAEGSIAARQGGEKGFTGTFLILNLLNLFAPFEKLFLLLCLQRCRPENQSSEFQNGYVNLKSV